MSNLCFYCMKEIGSPTEKCPHCGHDNQIRSNGPGMLRGGLLAEKYVLGRVLGRGGFGVTYIGYDVNLERRVAVKEYFPNNLAMRESTEAALSVLSGAEKDFVKGRERALKESKMAAKLGQIPGVVQIYDVLSANNTVYIVMEYIEGSTLTEYVEKQDDRLSLKAAVELLSPVAQALRILHKQSVIHRDVKPDNIMIRALLQQGVLLDFGAARMMDGKTLSNSSAVVSPGYAPPEQYNATSLDGRIDQFAFASTLYFTLTGQRPPDVMMRIADENSLTPITKYNPGVPAAAEKAIFKAMSIKAGERFEDMEAFWDAICAAAEGKSGAARKTAQVKKTEKPDTKEKKKGAAVRVIAGLVCLVLAGAVGVLALGGLGKIPADEPVAAVQATEVVTDAPTEAPTEVPTEVPTEEPTEVPTEEPTEVPTEEPTATPEPNEEPTSEPTATPTATPTVKPTEAPAATATAQPAYEYVRLNNIDGYVEADSAHVVLRGVPNEYGKLLTYVPAGEKIILQGKVNTGWYHVEYNEMVGYMKSEYVREGVRETGEATEKSTQVSTEVLTVSSITKLIGKKVGISFPTQSLQRWNQDGYTMKTQLETAGIEVDLQFASNDVAIQVSQIENMLLGGCEVLVVAPIDGGALDTVLGMAKEAGVPVIAYDRLLTGTVNVDYFTTFDNYGVGVIQGQYIVDRFDLDNAEGPFTIEFTAGSPDANNAGLFFAGAYDTLKPYIDAGKLVVVSGQTDFQLVATPAWKSKTAQARMDNILTAYYPDALTGGQKLDICLCSNDSTALGVTNSLLNFGFTAENMPVITGQDCDVQNIKNIIAGLQAMSVFKDTTILASETAAMVIDILCGRIPETNAIYSNGRVDVPTYHCEAVVVDENNFVERLIDSGLYTENQVID